MESCRPDRLIVIPAGTAPHKEGSGATTGEQRLELCRLAFGHIAGVEVSDMEMRRRGKSYTVDTLRALQEMYPGDELMMVVGTDMFLSLETWHEAEYILRNAHICVLRRDSELEAIEAAAAMYAQKYRSRVTVLRDEPLEAASSELRCQLPLRGGRKALPESVYAAIISCRLYGAKPDFDWLRRESYALLKPKRMPHVRGCEAEAVRLARRWGADEEEAAEAAILHDCTKRLSREEQLILCEKYGIIPDGLEAVSEKLMHARTGAALARERFGVSDEVYEAIRWHTTGKADMSLMEKLIYMADYVEPNRDFPGVEKLRELAYSDLDAAMVLGLEMSMEDLESYGVPVHPASAEALEFYRKNLNF